MTAYTVTKAERIQARGRIEVSVEIRTVNSKYLDFQLRCGRAYLPFESRIQQLVRRHIKRGRVDLTLQCRSLSGPSKEIRVHLEQAIALKEALERVQKTLQLNGSVTLSDLLKIPDWLESADWEASPEDWDAIAPVIEEALRQIVSERQREGSSLFDALLEQRDNFETEFQALSAQNDAFMRQVVDRARRRVQELFQNQNFDPQRLEQEVVLWAARADTREEIDRIQHHLTSLSQLFKTSGEVGRKLEFVLQELHRETNTMGSKCPDAAASSHVIEMKTCIERMREQIQNVE